MNDLEKNLFLKLKKDILSVFKEDFPNSEDDISKFKGIYITYFQEHLFKKSKGTISEKWFYTYFKSEITKLPRIDILNFLSIYCGYQSWFDYKEENKSKVEQEIKLSEKKETKFKYSLKQLIIPLIILFFISCFFGYNLYNKSQHTYTFRFKDTDRNNTINSRVEIEIPKYNYSSEKYQTKNGVFEYISYEDTIQMYVKSPYYLEDTITINLKLSKGTEIIELTPDDYAILLYYYSKLSFDKIEKKRIELNRIIDDNALIYQVYDNENYGQEVITKEQYINLLTLPTTSLKNFSLIHSEKKNNKIVKIKFKIPQDEK